MLLSLSWSSTSHFWNWSFYFDNWGDCVVSCLFICAHDTSFFWLSTKFSRSDDLLVLENESLDFFLARFSWFYVCNIHFNFHSACFPCRLATRNKSKLEQFYAFYHELVVNLITFFRGQDSIRWLRQLFDLLYLKSCTSFWNPKSSGCRWLICILNWHFLM